LLSFSVSEEDAGERLDVVLSGTSGVARSQISRWIEQGRVTVDGASCKASHRVSLGSEINAEPPDVVRMAARPEAIELDILFEDSHLIVVNKRAGMVVHPAPGHPSKTLVNALLHHCGDLAGIGGVLRPGIVHRLDQGTSGVIVAAKNDAAHGHLAAQFHDHSIHRVYRTFVRSVPRDDAGEIDRAIGRHPRDRKRMSIKTRVGRAAKTLWSVERRFSASSVALLEIRPQTGRTHQIRVHLASAGMPIVGDRVYGRARRDALSSALDRPALHAAELGFEHPSTGETLRFSAELPPDLSDLLELLAGREPG
jgi:23S rRNA pseudouridine1911/1915/1917 synthase